MLTFDADTHTYRWKGAQVPSVTQVLAPYTDLSKIPRAILERKRQIGTAVHKAIELDLADDLDEDSIAEECRGYFEGWRRFREQSYFGAALSEHQAYSEKFGYAGTLDLFGSLPSGPALIDTKCTTFVYPTAGPQTSAYAELIGKPKIDRYILQLSPDGKYELHPCRDRADWAIFQAALTLHHWRTRNA